MHQASRFTFHVSLLACAAGFSLSAAELTSTNLPPPARQPVDFDRDIRPILETSCLRCHGPAKPKSHFRLDNRESALRGGDNNTNDIVPGDGRGSRLVHYVARQVPDMEMPPLDRGEPLTTRQVALLRAWIDQGAIWNSTNQAPPLVLNFEPTLRGIGVHGDAAKFRELEGRQDGFGGGVEDILFSQQTGPDEKFLLEGHALAPDHDFRLKLAVDETDLGFLHAGFEEWRKYYDDTGGYHPALVPPAYSLNRDLYVDHGRLWVDLGLTRPHWPQMVLGYEYQFKNGNESMLDWGTAPGGGTGKNIYPATRAIDEQTHIIRLDVSHDFNDWHVENNARVEFYGEKNRSDETSFLFSSTAPDNFARTQDDYHHVQGMDTLMLEKQIRSWWFLTAGGYYSRLEGDDLFNQTATNTTFGFGSSVSSRQITLQRESEIFSVASSFTPLTGLSFSLGTQNEWTREKGFGNAPDFEFSIPDAFESANLDRFKSSQNANLRFTKIPFTVVFADARFSQESDDEFQQADPASDLTRRTDATNDRYDLRGGFNTSPWRWSDLSAEYRWLASDTDYQHLQDVWGSGFGAPTNGYPAFMLGRAIREHQFDTKLTLRPANWLKTTLTCQIGRTEYSTRTDPAIDLITQNPVSPGGQILAGKNDTRTCGINVMLTPFRQFYFSSAFTCTWSRLTTANNGDPSIAPYRGNVYTVLNTASYALNAKTALQASYNFTRADYGQNNIAGVPLGIDFTRHQLLIGLARKFSDRLSGSLRYSFSQYSEPSSGSLNNFTAHGLFAALDYRWP